MSHFTVAVRLPSSVSAIELHTVLEQRLLPFKEAGCGSNDPPELKQYLKWVDEEQDTIEEYEKGSVEMISLPNGELVLEWDERFRVPGTFGFGSGTHKAPAEYERIKVPFRMRYVSVEEYAREWEGRTRDPEKKRFGYWRNPNQKWDWFTIGGRWKGMLKTKQGNRDVCLLKNLDWNAISAENLGRAEKFVDELQQFMRDGKEFDMFEGPRETAINLGFLKCRDGKDLTGKEVWTKMRPPGHFESDRYDVIDELPDPGTFALAISRHFNPIRTYAAIDVDGKWHSPGEMGWFGMSSDLGEADAHKQYDAWFASWVKSGDLNDWIVIVDCHI